jgi:enoyl-CoA hydratase/carnithine racemase
MAYENVIIDKEGNIGIITLNRPPANPINYAVLDELDKALTELEEDKAIRALIITGAGERGFSVGFDVKVAGALEAEKIGAKGHEVFTRIERYSKPVVAAINGFALGGGCELSMACHFRVMVDKERVVIGCPEVNLGIIPGWGGTQRLPRLIGKTRALDMLIFGKRINAPEALNIGLITKVSQPGELMKDAKELAGRLAKQAPLAVKAILESVNMGLETSIDEGLKIEGKNLDMVSSSKDAIEGMTAFMQKRAPQFKGE